MITPEELRAAMPKPASNELELEAALGRLETQINRLRDIAANAKPHHRDVVDWAHEEVARIENAVRHGIEKAHV